MMNNFKFWWTNARPISLPQSLLPALTAVALSYGQNEFSCVFRQFRTSHASHGWEAVNNHMWPEEPIQAG